MGGVLDGIALHQILQWHSMLSSVVPTTDLIGMKVNMAWDGVFHLVTWITTLAGIALLFRAARRPRIAWSGRVLTGSMLAGWGLFNFVEGVIDHQLLGIHHVRPGEHVLAWDLAFLASGLVLMLVGWKLARSHSRLPSGPVFDRVDVPA